MSIVDSMQKLFAELRTQFNDPNGQYWLPTQLECIEIKGKKLLPLQETNWDFILTGNAGSTFANTILSSWWQSLSNKPGIADHQPIADPADASPHLSLPVLSVTGLNNAQIGPNKDVKATGATSFDAKMDLTFGGYSQLPQIEITGKYSLIQHCCSGPANTTPTACDGFATYEVDGKGDVVISITGMVVEADVSFAVVGKEFDVTLNSLTVSGPSAGLPNLKIDKLTIVADAVAAGECLGAIGDPGGRKQRRPGGNLQQPEDDAQPAGRSEPDLDRPQDAGQQLPEGDPHLSLRTGAFVAPKPFGRVGGWRFLATTGRQLGCLGPGCRPRLGGRAPPRLLLVGHAGSPTGFARVLHSLARHLSARWEVHHLGINLHREEAGWGWTAHPNPRPEETHAESGLPELARRIEPRVVVILDEVWAAACHEGFLSSAGDGSKTVVYAAIDDPDVIEESELRALSGLDSLVVFTRFARGAVESRVAELRRANPSLAFPPCRVIPHGVDTDQFRPLGGGLPDGLLDGLAAGRRSARRRLFPHRPELDDAFIVLNANRNQPYKRIDLTLEGFARFARGKPANVKLYLHMGLAAAAGAEAGLIDRLGIRDRLLLTTEGDRHPEVSSDRLNWIYNACDVGVNTSEIEGWGLVAFEHAATGAVQIVPGHATCREIWEDGAILLAPVPGPPNRIYWFRGRPVEPDDLAAALERLYARPDLLRERSLAAYRQATKPELEWRNIAGVWDRHLSELLGGPEPGG